MRKRKKIQLGIGLAVILGAIAYIVFGGLQQAVVYFFTPQELLAKGTAVQGKAVRVGGVVEKGTLVRDPHTLKVSFTLSDGKKSLNVLFQGIPPDLFGEERGAIVEGTLQPDGTFRANTIMAKHSEEYKPHKDGSPPDPKEVYKTLLTGDRR
ncbi:MAG TPA: cytochrome c maturation protein CcmE [bacterium]|nr:cytochrome c maturation protein CcmE [bacterium]